MRAIPAPLYSSLNMLRESLELLIHDRVRSQDYKLISLIPFKSANYDTNDTEHIKYLTGLPRAYGNHTQSMPRAALEDIWRVISVWEDQSGTMWVTCFRASDNKHYATLMRDACSLHIDELTKLADAIERAITNTYYE